MYGITCFAEEVHKNAKTKGFWDKYNGSDEHILAKIALIHTEVAEATEAIRLNDMKGFAEELADIIIRTLDIAEGLNVKIEREIIIKMNYNEKREYMHGKRI